VSRKKFLTEDITLVISFSFNIETEHRQEILYAMQQNSLVVPLFILYDGPNNECQRVQHLFNLTFYSVSCVYFGPSMPTYFDMVLFLKTIPSQFVILSNADILFDETILWGKELPPKYGYAISWSSWSGKIPKGEQPSRCLPKEHELCLNTPKTFVYCWPERLHSIDSFIFRTKDLAELTDDGFYDTNSGKKYRMNVPAAEFAFVGALQHQGFEFQNVCRFIKTTHIHYSKKSHLLSSQERVYSKYGVLNPQVRNRPFLKQIIYHGKPSDIQYKLPFGI
tara:strand:+ start:524 stop:1360 length:837 start_codon:yes stop_codon:yes gene_type:complete